MYTVLTGAKKNVGDFLIQDRSLKLLQHLKPNEQFVQYNSWERLDAHLERINQSKALIICGGPGYKQDMYPNVYPLVGNIDDIKVPIYILGAGWYGITGDESVMKRYKFTEPALKLLRKAEQTGGLSCRDYYTKRVLQHNGIRNVTMTGCPVMYNLTHLHEQIKPPKQVETIVFTTPQDPIYTRQCLSLMNDLRMRFPKQRLIASFHRGVGREQGTGVLEGLYLEKMREEAERLHYEVVDASYELSKIRFYSSTDLHIGYRVHAHLYFLSERKPSFLINEDGRGTGFCDLLGLQGVNAYKASVGSKLSTRINHRALKKIVNKTLAYSRVQPDISGSVISFVDEELENGFIRFEGVDELIDRYYSNMKSFITAI